jgi:carboxypeptidase C (cathepsin A)
MVGFFMEVGPFVVSTTSTLEENLHSWNKDFNMLFIDNPAGSGFSYGPDARQYPNTAVDTAQELYEALQVFFDEDHFPQYNNNSFYVVGESYAGKYAIALTIINEAAGKLLNLKGIALGNAWVNPDIQERSYGNHAYGFGLFNYRSFVQVNA